MPTETDVGWLSPERLELVRAHVPLVYVDAVPVRSCRTGHRDRLLLRVAADGTISRMVVSGRVLPGERVRDALLRHLEKDLGPLAPPQQTRRRSRSSSTSGPRLSRPTPPRRQPGLRRARRRRLPADRKALDLAWFNPAEAVSDAVRGDDWRPRPPHPPWRTWVNCRRHPPLARRTVPASRRWQMPTPSIVRRRRCARRSSTARWSVSRPPLNGVTPRPGARSSRSRATASMSRNGTTPWCCTRTCG